MSGSGIDGTDGCDGFGTSRRLRLGRRSGRRGGPFRRAPRGTGSGRRLPGRTSPREETRAGSACCERRAKPLLGRAPTFALGCAAQEKLRLSCKKGEAGRTRYVKRFASVIRGCLWAASFYWRRCAVTAIGLLERYGPALRILSHMASSCRATGHACATKRLPTQKERSAPVEPSTRAAGWSARTRGRHDSSESTRRRSPSSGCKSLFTGFGEGRESGVGPASRTATRGECLLPAERPLRRPRCPQCRA